MARIFKKTHFWKDKRTYIDLDADQPTMERGFPKEGAVTLKIGDQDNLKAAFKMQVDEIRALRDVLDFFIDRHDKKMAELHAKQYANYKKSTRGETSSTQSSSSFQMKEKKKEEGEEEKKEQKEEVEDSSSEPKPKVMSFEAGSDEKKEKKPGQDKESKGLTLFKKDEEEKGDDPALRPYY